MTRFGELTIVRHLTDRELVCRRIVRLRNVHFELPSDWWENCDKS